MQSGMLRGLGAVLATASAATAQRAELSEIWPDDCAGVGGFGLSVTAEGTLALVSGYGDGVDAASAWLFDISDPANPTQLLTLTPDDGTPGDAFGGVQLRGNLAAVGASSADETGSIYLFDLTTGDQLSKVEPPNGDDGDRFRICDLHGDLLLVGAPGDDDAGTDAGAAYLFDISDPADPQLLAKLAANDGGTDDAFGANVVLGDDLAAISATRDNSQTGSVYLFDVADPGNPVQVAKFTSSDAQAFDQFGHAMDIDGDTLIVGTPNTDSDEFGTSSGSVYLFDISDPSNPDEFLAILPGEDAADYFGNSVALQGTTALIGAIGVPEGTGMGRAFVYDIATGQRLLSLAGSDISFGEQLGESVALAGETALVGAPEHFHGCHGSAYLFSIAPCRVDLNGDGRGDTRDALAFLNLWASGDPEADWNGDGSVDSADVTAFLNDWAAGC